jgi:hypothetical protein
MELFPNGDSGPIVVCIALAIGGFLLWRANKAQSVEPDETVSEHPSFGPRATPAPVAA